MDTQTVAKFVTSLDAGKLPRNVKEHAKLCILDNLGVMLGGLEARAARAARSYVAECGGKRESTLFGTSKKVPAPQAALANCVAASVLDWDDGHNLGGHPGGVIVPSALAVAEAEGASGKLLLEGVVAGYEVGIRAMENLCSTSAITYPSSDGKPITTSRPYHSTGAGASYGAAAAAAKISGLDPGQTANALGIDAAHTPITRPYLIPKTGHNVKEVLGWAGITGVESAYLARHGFTGPNTIFDDKETQGTSVDTIGKSFEILNNYFKPYPACRVTHAVLDALLYLMKEHSLKADDVAKVEVLIKKNELSLSSTRPVSIEQAQYSYPWVVGAALACGKLGWREMDDSRLADPVILKQVDKVSLKADSALDVERWPGGVVIKTRGGKTYRQLKLMPKGDPQEPMTSADLRAKFVDLATPVIGRAKANKVAKLVDGIEGVGDVRELTALLSGKA